MREDIATAVRERQLIRFNYRNEGFRVAEPHCYGQSKRNNEVLLAFQTSGHTKRGGIPDWRMFAISDMTSIQVLQDRFRGPRPDFNPRDRNMVRIFVALP